MKPGNANLNGRQTANNFMTINKEQRDAMLEAARPLIAWINENTHPHCSITVDHTTVELVEGVAAVKTLDYLKD